MEAANAPEPADPQILPQRLPHADPHQLQLPRALHADDGQRPADQQHQLAVQATSLGGTGAARSDEGGGDDGDDVSVRQEGLEEEFDGVEVVQVEEFAEVGQQDKYVVLR